MARVKFTKADARDLCGMRDARGMSQYEVAGKLGWVRSKIKRLEKHEVATVDEDDLAALKAVLGAEPVSGGRVGRRLGYDKADKGRPKPRLDYDEGTRRVLEVLHDARAEGTGFLHRGEIEGATGYTACQVRTFCKALEARGEIAREGNGRGMKYVPLGRPRGSSGAAGAAGAPASKAKVSGRGTEGVRRILREASRDAMLPVLREQVSFPGWLLALVRSEGLDDLSIRDVWG